VKRFLFNFVLIVYW